MDTEKLLRILNDLQSEETELTISARLDAIRASVAQNNPTGYDTAQTQLSELVGLVKEKSYSYSFSQTENIILKHINVENYYGHGLITQLEDIFNARSYEIVARIDEYKRLRTENVNRINKLVVALDDIGIEEYRPEKYEVGILLPDAEGDLDTLSKRIDQIRKLLSTVIEISGTEDKDLKITRVNNGSFELFSLQPVEVAELLTNILLNVSKIWDKVTQYRKKQEEIQSDEHLSSEVKKDIDTAIQKGVAKLKNEILEELPDTILKKAKKIDEGRKNEVRIAIKGSLKTLFGWFEAGIEIDITPVRHTDEDATEKTLKQIENVKVVNAKLRDIYMLPKELKQLPFPLPNDDDTGVDVKNK